MGHSRSTALLLVAVLALSCDTGQPGFRGNQAVVVRPAPGISVLAGPVSSPLPTGRVLTEVDEFRGTTFHKIADIRVTSTLGQSLDVDFLLVPEDPDPWMLLRSSAERWRYLGCHTMDMLIDGTPVPDLRVEHSGRVGGGVSETVKTHLTPQLLVQMGRATNDLRVRVCADVFTLTSEHRRLILELARRAYARDPSPPPPPLEAPPVEAPQPTGAPPSGSPPPQASPPQ